MSLDLKVLVTGVNGFVGKQLCLALFAQGQAEITGVRVIGGQRKSY